MASTGPRPQRPEGRIIRFFHPDVHVEVRRLGAAGLDLLVLLVVQTWINDVFGVTHAGNGAALTPIGDGYAYLTGATTVDPLWLALLAVVLYSVQEALFGATWGKLVAGLRVIDQEGGRPTLGAVLVRNILRLVDYWPGLYAVGIVAAMLSPRRQRLGDRVAHTLVVRAESALLSHRTRPELRRAGLALAGVAALLVALCLWFSYYGRPPLVIQGLANTNAFPTSGGVASYVLGAPRWGQGVVTYPVTYITLRPRQHCTGQLALRWRGFLSLGGGWRLDGASVHCQ